MDQTYAFKTKPYQHQFDAWLASRDAEFHALFLEMGTGKSKVAIDTMAYLFEKNQIDSALIVAPKGVYDNWVQKELPTHLPDRIPTMLVRWQSNTTKAWEDQIQKLFARGRGKLKPNEVPPLGIFVMNVEALSTVRGAKVATMFVETFRHTLVIVDESTTMKNRQAARTRALLRLSESAKYRRILTGSPITKSPMDLFSQCLFLSPTVLGFSSYFAFQNRYAIMVQRQLGHRSFQDIVGYRRLDELSEKLGKFSTRILKSECLDLPEKVYLRRNVALTPEQDQAYRQMKELALTQLESGELSTTSSVLTQIMRLQQIVCGHLTTDDDGIQELPNRRLDELLDLLDETQGKVIIWANWTHDIRKIEKALQTRYGKDSVATYYGDTPQDDRQKIVTLFQDESSPLRYFVGQPRTGGYGITLTAASTMVYYSNGYDLEIRLQSEDRAHRIGQRNTVTYIDLVSPGTIDEKILKALQNKVNLASQVLGEDVRSWFT